MNFMNVRFRVLSRKCGPLLVFGLCIFFVGVFLTVIVHWKKDNRPHIVFVLADDLGFNDLGYVRGSEFSVVNTPFLNRLVEESLELEFAYVQPICSASRAALLTGRYPFRIGYQRTALNANEMIGLHQKLFPERLQEIGYQTHLVGKWHVGHCRKEFTPLYKGFDTFRGFLGGNEGYYTHKGEKLYYDYWYNQQVLRNKEYSTTDYAKYTEELIMNNTDSRPMFLYLAMQAPHLPYDAPPGVNEEADDDFKYRKMVETIDMYAERVHRALAVKGMLENTIFIFSSDNGASGHGGSNYPLRGLKQDLFDGGTRVRSFLKGPGIPKGSYNGLFHITDWYPTILSMAGDRSVTDTDTHLDGIDQNKALRENRRNMDKHPRKHFIYDINEKPTKYNGTRHSGAIRVRTRDDWGDMTDYKYIFGLPGPSEPRLYSEEGLLFDMAEDERESDNIPGRKAVRRMMRYLIDHEKSRGYKKRTPIFNEDAYEIRDDEGRPIFGPGWC